MWIWLYEFLSFLIYFVSYTDFSEQFKKSLVKLFARVRDGLQSLISKFAIRIVHNPYLNQQIISPFICKFMSYWKVQVFFT